MKLILFTLSVAFVYIARADYTKPSAACSKCVDLERALDKFKVTTDNNAKIDELLRVTKIMSELPVQGEYRHHGRGL